MRERPERGDIERLERAGVDSERLEDGTVMERLERGSINRRDWRDLTLRQARGRGH